MLGGIIASILPQGPKNGATCAFNQIPFNTSSGSFSFQNLSFCLQQNSGSQQADYMTIDQFTLIIMFIP